MTLLAITGSIVLVLLVLIYRSPIFWAIPFFVVLLTEAATRGAGYLSAGGPDHHRAGTGILIVLVFGAATDYALLLVARYREELERQEDTHAAMRTALRSTGPGDPRLRRHGRGRAVDAPARPRRRHAGHRPLGAGGVALAVTVQPDRATGGSADRRTACVLAVYPAGRAGDGPHASAACSPASPGASPDARASCGSARRSSSSCSLSA